MDCKGDAQKIHFLFVPVPSSKTSTPTKNARGSKGPNQSPTATAQPKGKGRAKTKGKAKAKAVRTKPKVDETPETVTITFLNDVRRAIDIAVHGKERMHDKIEAMKLRIFEFVIKGSVSLPSLKNGGVDDFKTFKTWKTLRKYVKTKLAIDHADAPAVTEGQRLSDDSSSGMSDEEPGTVEVGLQITDLLAREPKLLSS
eukprot:9473801-Pyramimonas_sp.AAC.1